MTIDEMTGEVVQLAKEGDAHFLQLAKVLRELHDTLTGEGGLPNLEALDQCIKKARISKRKAYYLIEIDQVYGPMKTSRKRLAAVGWTKLGVIAKYVEEKTIGDWLKMAEENTVEYIKSFLASKEPATQVLTLRLTDAQYSLISGTLLANGAYLTGGAGIANKEAALMKVCRTLQKAWKVGIT